MTDCYWEYPLTYVHDFSIGNSVSWLPLFSASKSGYILMILLHSHKILTIQQGEPCYLSIWSNPVNAFEDFQRN